tara:strand:+ start:121 stop:837 length:717 start_codon:yes stop_codon:yes gene_type:complete
MRKNRKLNELRNIEIITNYSTHADGSCFIKFGDTHVLCNATVDENPPRWLRNSGQGWITAEYGMLPTSTNERMSRESVRGKQSGRTQEIQRLIGRSLRSIVNLSYLDGLQIILDCDVIQADGGTRTTSINGSFIALKICIDKMIKKRLIKQDPLIDQLAAISCGILDNNAYLDLDFEEDQSAGVDANFVLTKTGKIVEVQMTSEKDLCSEENYLSMFSLAKSAVQEIIKFQDDAINNA